MKLFKIQLFVLILFLFTNISFPWGEQGHHLIGKMAVRMLPKEMKDFKKWENYINDHSDDPDGRKKGDKTEPPKHFIDIDSYKEFMNGKMVTDLNELKKIYADSVILDYGIVPWATIETYNALVKAFKDKNKEKVMLYMSDLSHYVGDGNQPMHAVTNYNGQLTGQKGLHGRYEFSMLDSHLVEIEQSIKKVDVEYVKDKLAYIFDYISKANLISNVIYDADNQSYKIAGAREGSEYYKIMWFRTKDITELQINRSVSALVSLMYSAWVDGGKPAFNKLK